MKAFRRVIEWGKGPIPNRVRRSEGVEILRDEGIADRARLPDERVDHAEIRSYGEIERCHAEVHTPETVDELRALLVRLANDGRKVTFRAGGCSLDGQSLNDDVVVFLDELDGIVIDDHPTHPTITVGPGATWGNIVRALEPRGLVPGIVVTASRATAGGTASADGVSRFSSTLGKESAFIEKLTLLTVDGAFHELSRDASDPQELELFRGVIGGFGYLGAVVSVTYAVLRPKAEGPPRERLRVKTRVTKSAMFDTFADPGHGVSPPLPPSPTAVAPRRAGACRTIARELHASFSEASTAARATSQADLRERPRAFYGVVCPGPRPRGLAFESVYVRSDATNPMLQHQPEHTFRPLAEWVARFGPTSSLFWAGTFQMFQEGVDYVDELFGYTFFMDGNVRTHALERRLGLRTFTLQQTYVIPFRPDLLESFLERTLAFFDERGLLPVLFDVLFVPGDEMILSASRGGDGFAVTVAFETMNEAELEARTEALADLSEICASVGGKIHLVKTVCASPEVLKRMFGPAIAEFGALKRRVDPKGILVNRFLEKTFPELTR